jgi:hypothetical protein
VTWIYPSQLVLACDHTERWRAKSYAGTSDTMIASRGKNHMGMYQKFETHCPTCGQRYNAAGLHCRRFVISGRAVLVLLAVAFAVGLAVGLLLAA